MWGNKNIDSADLQFSTRADAFAYMLKYQLEEKKAEPLDAAEKANQFADILVANMGIPDRIEPPKQGVDKAIEVIDKAVCYCDEHPRILEFLTGAATFAVGLISGRKSTQQAPLPLTEKINFNEID